MEKGFSAVVNLLQRNRNRLQIAAKGDLRLFFCITNSFAHITLVAYYKLFEWYTASSIRMGSAYRSDSMRHAGDVCKGICNRMILHFSYCCKYGILVFDDDGTAPVDESKRTKGVQGWSRQIMRGRLSLFAILLLCEITTSFV